MSKVRYSQLVNAGVTCLDFDLFSYNVSSLWHFNKVLYTTVARTIKTAIL